MQRWDKTYHDQNAMKNPNHEKKKTLPYLLTGLKTGMDLALWFTGLSSGLRQRTVGENILTQLVVVAMNIDPLPCTKRCMEDLLNV